MDAPVYPAAKIYHEPTPVACEFGIDTLVVNDLLMSPAIKAILEEMLPMFDRIIQHPLLKPHLSNFTLRSLSDFGIIPTELLTAMEQRLLDIPAADRPKL